MRRLRLCLDLGRPGGPMTSSVFADVFETFFDDAAVFPPGNMPMPQAVTDHGSHHRTWYAPTLGPFVCPAERLNELRAVWDGRRPLPLSLLLPGPAGLTALLQQAERISASPLKAVEVALPVGMPLAEALRMLDDQLPEDVPCYLEVPRGAQQDSALDTLAATRYRAKFRTGGAEPEAHPDEWELAQAILSAVRRGVPFKCTAGLHHAVRHTDGVLEQHGFLNVLLATAAAADGADRGDVAAVLAQRSSQEVTRQIRSVDPRRLMVARACFVSFGTCSIFDPITDLVALNLMHPLEEKNR
jgi:hypothetical protein